MTREQIKDLINITDRFNFSEKRRLLDLLSTWPEDGLTYLIKALGQTVKKTSSESTYSRILLKDLEDYKKAASGQEYDLPQAATPPQLTPQTTEQPKLRPEAKDTRPKLSTTSRLSPDQLKSFELGDILARVKMRTEAGLIINSQDAKLIIELIKLRENFESTNETNRRMATNGQ